MISQTAIAANPASKFMQINISDDPERWSGQAIIICGAVVRQRYTLDDGRVLTFSATQGGKSCTYTMLKKSAIIEGRIRNKKVFVQFSVQISENFDMCRDLDEPVILHLVVLPLDTGISMMSNTNPFTDSYQSSLTKWSEWQSWRAELIQRYQDEPDLELGILFRDFTEETIVVSLDSNA